MRRAPALIAALALLAASPFAAAEEPEAVFAKYHRAAASGNVEDMARYVPDEQRAELSRMSPAAKDAQAKMLMASMPRAFLLRRKTLHPDGQGATLIVSGPSGMPGGDKPETLYGTVRMVMERGEWKVGGAVWGADAPASLAARPAPEPAKAGAAKKAGAPVVGTMDSAPVRKLGKQKPPCEFKPVMSAEDLENCR